MAKTIETCDNCGNIYDLYECEECYTIICGKCLENDTCPECGGEINKI